MTSTSAFFPLATENPYPEDVHGGPPNTGVDNAAGASGSSPGAVEISRGALIAIIVVVVVVGVIGSEFPRFCS